MTDEKMVQPADSRARQLVQLDARGFERVFDGTRVLERRAIAHG